uniref:AAA+ ATPase domain-containing protein n=1 Tax=Knipowitschia caucasica TaxID=637954 RepID=A0AAV2JQ03_KNICA
MIKHVFLTGQPGVGKSTLVQKACESLVSSGTTVEEGSPVPNTRHGWSISSHGAQEYTVGQYVVDLSSFENLVLPLFRNLDSGGSTKKVFVVDEFGKMELFSQSFIRAVRQTLDQSCCTVLGTIPVLKHKPLALVEEVRGRSDVKVFTITKENRDSILRLNVLPTVSKCLKQM